MSAQNGWTARLAGPRTRAELRSPDTSTRVAAAERLGQWGEPRQAVRALLEALPEEREVLVRRAIFEALARRGDASAVGPLTERLTEWDRADRTRAIRTVGAIGGERAIRALVEWLGAAEVGENAVDALVEAGAPAVPHLLRALGVPIASARAARALGRIGDTRATFPILSRLHGALPAARLEMLQALGAIGDERAAPAVARYLTHADPATVSGALDALSRIAGSEHARPVAALADRGTTEQRAHALRALVVMDPVAAAPRVDAVLNSVETPAVLHRAAVEAIVEHPSRPLRGVLTHLLSDETLALPAAEALSRVEDGAGAPILLARASMPEGRRFDPALALSVRRHADVLPGRVVDRARAHLRADPSARGLVFAAVAQDPSIDERVSEGLGAADPVERAHAALALLLLDDPPGELVDRVASRLLEEDDPIAFRALARAALRVGARVDPARIDPRWWDSSTAPEAFWLSAVGLRDAAPRTRDRVRRAMRRSLRAGQARVRAGAALALALAADRAAWRALVATLDDEHDAVRFAVARALTVLAVPAAADAISSRARVEANEHVRSALRGAAEAPGRRSPGAFGRGDEVLFVRVSTAPGLSRGPDVSIDVLLPDGRWLRTVALPTGEVLVPNLPAGEAEVTVRIDP